MNAAFDVGSKSCFISESDASEREHVDLYADKLSSEQRDCYDTGAARPIVFLLLLNVNMQFSFLCSIQIKFSCYVSADGMRGIWLYNRCFLSFEAKHWNSSVVRKAGVGGALIFIIHCNNAITHWNNKVLCFYWEMAADILQTQPWQRRTTLSLLKWTFAVCLFDPFTNRDICVMKWSRTCIENILDHVMGRLTQVTLALPSITQSESSARSSTVINAKNFKNKNTEPQLKHSLRGSSTFIRRP